ncbi:MAG: type II toxin-antitoxin system MqsA family antitoxin [Deltaproteobacteria bacterium]|nr:type II toxin-antitoxin system MqsA family antitoxin [Deltaproteobacteria bacterium]
MTRKKVAVDYWWKKELTIIENVPAWVCTQCGEEVFEGPVVEEMERVARAKKKKGTVVVPVKVFGDSPHEPLPAIG